MKLSKKYTIVYYIIYCFIFCIPLCLLFCIDNGSGHVDLMTYLYYMAVGMVACLAVVAVVPLARMAEACTRYFGAEEGTLGFRVVKCIFFATFFLLIASILLKAAFTGFVVTEALNPYTGLMEPINLFDRYVAHCFHYWPPIVVLAFLCDPLSGGLANVFVKPEDRFVKADRQDTVLSEGEPA